MLAAHALAGITAQSVAEVEDQVTPPQLRVLVLIAGPGPLNLNTLARALGVHPSNATRASNGACQPGSPTRAGRHGFRLSSRLMQGKRCRKLRLPDCAAVTASPPTCLQYAIKLVYEGCSRQVSGRCMGGRRLRMPGTEQRWQMRWRPSPLCRVRVSWTRC